jgi:hypothetical protein
MQELIVIGLVMFGLYGLGCLFEVLISDPRARGK